MGLQSRLTHDQGTTCFHQKNHAHMFNLHIIFFRGYPLRVTAETNPFEDRLQTTCLRNRSHLPFGPHQFGNLHII